MAKDRTGKGRRVDFEKYKKLAEMLAQGPLTLAQVMDITGLPERTAYRWLEMLQDEGFDVVRRRVAGGMTYEILDAPDP